MNLIRCPYLKLGTFNYKEVKGEGSHINMYYMWPGYSLDMGLKQIFDNNDVMKMLEAYSGF